MLAARRSGMERLCGAERRELESGEWGRSYGEGDRRFSGGRRSADRGGGVQGAGGGSGFALPRDGQPDKLVRIFREGKRMVSGLTRNQVPGNRLRVRIPCPPLV
jgi:hypothetical protein